MCTNTTDIIIYSFRFYYISLALIYLNILYLLAYITYEKRNLLLLFFF